MRATSLPTSAYLGALAALVLLAGGCRDDDTSNGISDGGPTVDAQLTCSATCQAEAPYYCVPASTAGSCVECTLDIHCAGNSGALGTRCDPIRNVCTCSKDSDCNGKSHGARCDAASRSCGCAKDSDCTSPATCIGKVGSTSVCQKPCKADGDCKGKVAPRCQTSSGRCIQCLTASDCKGSGLSVCDAGSGSCVQCTQNSDCSGTAQPICDTTSKTCVECTLDTDCKAATAWGNRCLSRAGSPSTCGCTKDTDCAGNVNGPRCDLQTGKCTCTKDAECKNASFPACSPPYKGARYNHCQAGCTKNTECQSTLKCLTSLKKCGECLPTQSSPDAECSSGTTYARCHPTMNRCVACRATTAAEQKTAPTVLDTSTSDCRTPTPLCNTDTGNCAVCRTDTECKDNPSGSRCGPSGCTCTTDSDCAKGFGPTCVQLTPKLRRCACASDSDCSKNSFGPGCYLKYKKCSCDKTAQCASGNACFYPYSGATYRQCQTQCTADKDCTTKDRGFKKCDTPRGVCINCQKDTDCASNPNKKICDASTGACTECKVDKDCASQPLKIHCYPTAGRCVDCKTASHCSKNPWAKMCDPAEGCVECQKDSDCSATSLGATCATGLCICLTDTHCASNTNGKRCEKTWNTCSCTSDTDCPGGTTCSKTTALGTKICK